MNRAQLDEILEVGEGQHVEFKASLARQREGTESMVAFANAQGGRVFFGVQNDGKVKGVQIGNNTLENLANYIKDHTYPSLPTFIDHIDYDGKQIVIAEAPEDVPPIIGVYLYSSQAIPPDSPVDPDRLQAYRRVGRTNQKEDFMHLRQALPSDPKLRIALRRSYLADEPLQLSGFSGAIWVEEGSATAHAVNLRLDPPVCECSDGYDDLPFPVETRSEIPGGRFQGYKTEYHLKVRFEFEFSCERYMVEFPSSPRLIAMYKDDQGLTWESVRRLEVYVVEGSGKRVAQMGDGGQFTRRIVRFPPKVE
jgi:hypothetical protein